MPDVVTASVDGTKVDRSASSCSSSQSATAFRTRPIGDKVYTHDDLEIYNLLQHPVWIFDLERKAMFWSNTAGLEVWNATTLEELLARDFTKVSTTIEERMQGNLDRIKRGEILSELWTAYPKGKPKTLQMTGSAIRIENSRIAALCEAELLYKTEAFDHASVRAFEMLRYLPIPVRQFDGDGKSLKYQNSEAQALFGAGTTDSSVNRNNREEGKEEEKRPESFEENAFLDRFVDRTLGKHVLDQVKEDHDYKVEADQYVNQGNKIETRPFSICVRLASDPVDASPIILYSAREITEILHARKATAKANLKSDFMAVISHEIRTPLHQIIGFMELLELSGGLSESQLGTIKLVQTSSATLQSIINDLLCYARLENGKLKLESKIFDPIEVLNACAASIKVDVQEKGLNLLHSNHGLPSRLFGDPYRLRQILFNLLENATKYTQIGTISMIASLSDCSNKEKELLRIEIKDTGIGIHPLHHARVFVKYEQVDSSISWKNGGTGLGLSICKSLTEIMGGTITMESELGKGTTFILEIPFDVSNEKVKGLSEVNKKAKKDKTLPQKREAEKGLNILVVEDNIVNQKMARKMLQRMGHVTTAANNGKEAVDEIRGNLKSYDLVLMDVQMPVLDGIDATKQIRNILGLQKSTLPIVGLTASFEPSALGYYQEIGMNTCIGKPVRMNSLERAIDNAALERNLEELRLK